MRMTNNRRPAMTKLNTEAVQNPPKKLVCLTTRTLTYSGVILQNLLSGRLQRASEVTHINREATEIHTRDILFLST